MRRVTISSPAHDLETEAVVSAWLEPREARSYTAAVFDRNGTGKHAIVLGLCAACSGGNDISADPATGGAAPGGSTASAGSGGVGTLSRNTGGSDTFPAEATAGRGTLGGTASAGTYGSTGIGGSATLAEASSVVGTSTIGGASDRLDASGGNLAGGTSPVASSSVQTGGITSSTGGTSFAENATGGSSTQNVPTTFVTQPTFVGNDNPAVPQAGILRVETDVPAPIEVTVSGGGEQWSLSLPARAKTEAPIVGLKPDTLYQISVRAGTATLSGGPLEWRTPPLPQNFPPIQVAISVPEEMEPGMTLFAPRDGWNMAQAPIIIVDHAGVVRWYFSDPENRVQEDLRRLENGNFLFGRDFCNLREVDVLGNVIGTWHAANYPRTCDVPSGSIPVNVTDFHHESREISNGNLLVLSTESRTIEGFPTSEDDASEPTQSALVLGSVIVEFTRAGQIVKQVSLLDLLDPTRIGRDSLDTSWPSSHVARGQRARDWDHANAVIYDLASDSYYVSLRHQDAVVKVSRANETLTWILGTPANWREPWSNKLLAPQGDLTWPFHQHAVELNSFGLGLYDNGNYRAAAYESYDPDHVQYSRAVAYQIDEQARSVKQVWSYGPASGADSVYS